MHLIITKNSEEIAELLSKIIIDLVKQKPNTVLGLATGLSPVATYQLLIKDYQDNQTDWSKVVTFNLDEYLGCDKTDRNSYYYFMKEQLFKHINIKEENTHIPNGLGNGQKNADEYEKLISKYDPIDLQVLGLGSNGHIGFNEPGSDINSITRVVDLSKETIEANKRFFSEDESRVPKQAITMGIATIMKAKSIVLIASGKNKAQAVKALVQGEISANWPCSYLQNHPKVLILIDKQAAELLDLTKVEENSNA